MSKLKIILNKQLSVGVILASVLLLGTIIGFGIHLVFAWSGPVANPPNQNIAAPITATSAIIGSMGSTWNSWHEAIRFSDTNSAAINYPTGGILFGLHSNGNFYWANTSDNPGTYLLTLSNAGNLTASGSFTSGTGYLYLRSQSLYGDNSSALYWDANHSTITQMFFRDLENTTYGRVYGSGDGVNFGLLDGDGSWSYLAVKDTSTDFRIDSISELTITPTQIDVKSNRITNVATPTAASDAATKGYVDALAQGATAFRYAEGNTAPCPVVAGLTLRGAYYWDGLQNRPGAGADCAARQTCICFYSSL